MVGIDEAAKEGLTCRMGGGEGNRGEFFIDGLLDPVMATPKATPNGEVCSKRSFVSGRIDRTPDVPEFVPLARRFTCPRVP